MTMPKRNRHTGARSRRRRQVRGFRLTVECLESRTVLSAMVMPANFVPERGYAADLTARHFDSPQPGAIVAEVGMRASVGLGHQSQRLEQTPLAAPGPAPLDSAFDDVGFRSAAEALFDSGGPDPAFSRDSFGYNSLGQRGSGLHDNLPRYDRGPVADAFWDTMPDRDYQRTYFAASTSSWRSSSSSTSAWSSLQSLDQPFSDYDTVMSGVLHVEIVIPPSNLLFSLLTISTFAEPQGGLVSLNSQAAETSLPRLGTLAASRARASTPSENVPLRNSFAADSFDTIGSRANGQFPRGSGRQLIFNSLLEIPSAATAASSNEEGGLLRLSVDRTLPISNWIGSGTVYAVPEGTLVASSGLERIEPRLSESRGEQPLTEWYDLETGLRSSSSLQMASIAGDIEGGVIDIGAAQETYSILHDPALTPSREATGRRTSQQTKNEYSEQRGESNESRGDVNSSDDTEHSRETGCDEANATHAAAVDQGGMIALDSPTDSTSGVFFAEAGVSPTVQSAAVLTLASAGKSGVQMDAGVGLYQVFELATAPGQLADQTVSSNRITTGQPQPQANGTATPAAAGRQPKGQPHADDGGLSDLLLRLAATVPAVLFLASLPIRRTTWRKPAMRIANKIRILTMRFRRPRS